MKPTADTDAPTPDRPAPYPVPAAPTDLDSLDRRRSRLHPCGKVPLYAYRRDWADFRAWCAAHGREPLPAAPAP